MTEVINPISNAWAALGAVGAMGFLKTSLLGAWPGWYRLVASRDLSFLSLC